MTTTDDQLLTTYDLTLDAALAEGVDLRTAERRALRAVADTAIRDHQEQHP